MATADGRRRVSNATEAAPAQKGKRTKVRATRTGYYNEQRYREGDVFIFAGEKLPSWVESVAASTPERVTTGQEQINTELEQVRADRLSSGDADVI